MLFKVVICVVLAHLVHAGCDEIETEEACQKADNNEENLITGDGCWWDSTVTKFGVGKKCKAFSGDCHSIVVVNGSETEKKNSCEKAGRGGKCKFEPTFKGCVANCSLRESACNGYCTSSGGTCSEGTYSCGNVFPDEVACNESSVCSWIGSSGYCWSVPLSPCLALSETNCKTDGSCYYNSYTSKCLPFLGCEYITTNDTSDCTSHTGCKINEFGLCDTTCSSCPNNLNFNDCHNYGGCSCWWNSSSTTGNSDCKQFSGCEVIGTSSECGRFPSYCWWSNNANECRTISSCGSIDTVQSECESGIFAPCWWNTGGGYCNEFSYCSNIYTNNNDCERKSTCWWYTGGGYCNDFSDCSSIYTNNNNDCVRKSTCWWDSTGGGSCKAFSLCTNIDSNAADCERKSTCWWDTTGTPGCKASSNTCPKTTQAGCNTINASCWWDTTGTPSCKPFTNACPMTTSDYCENFDTCWWDYAATTQICKPFSNNCPGITARPLNPSYNCDRFGASCWWDSGAASCKAFSNTCPGITYDYCQRFDACWWDSEDTPQSCKAFTNCQATTTKNNCERFNTCWWDAPAGTTGGSHCKTFEGKCELVMGEDTGRQTTCTRFGCYYYQYNVGPRYQCLLTNDYEANCISLDELQCRDNRNPYYFSTYCKWNSTSCVAQCNRLEDMNDCWARDDCYISGSTCYAYGTGSCSYGNNDGACNSDKRCYYDYVGDQCLNFTGCSNVKGETGCEAKSETKRCVWDATRWNGTGYGICLDRILPEAEVQLGCSGFFTKPECIDNEYTGTQCVWNSGIGGGGVCVNFTKCSDISIADYGGNFSQPQYDCVNEVGCDWHSSWTGGCGVVGVCLPDPVTASSCEELTETLCTIASPYCDWTSEGCKLGCDEYKNSFSCSSTPNTRCIWNYNTDKCVKRNTDNCFIYDDHPFFCNSTEGCGYYTGYLGCDPETDPCTKNCTEYKTSDECTEKCYCYWDNSCKSYDPSCAGTTKSACERPAGLCTWVGSDPIAESGKCYETYYVKNFVIRGCDDIKNANECNGYLHNPGYGTCVFVFDLAGTGGKCELFINDDKLNCSKYHNKQQCIEVDYEERNCYWTSGGICAEYASCETIGTETECNTSGCVYQGGRCVDKCANFDNDFSSCLERDDCYWVWSACSSGGNAGKCKEFNNDCTAIFNPEVSLSKNRITCNDRHGCVWDSYTKTCVTQKCDGVAENFNNFANKADCVTKGCYLVLNDVNGTTGTCYDNYDVVVAKKDITKCSDYVNKDSCNADNSLAGTTGCNGKIHRGCFWNVTVENLGRVDEIVSGTCLPLEECVDILDITTCNGKTACAYDYTNMTCVNFEGCQSISSGATDCGNTKQCLYYSGTCHELNYSISCSRLSTGSCNKRFDCRYSFYYGTCEPVDACECYDGISNYCNYRNNEDAEKCLYTSSSRCIQSCVSYSDMESCHDLTYCVWDDSAKSCKNCNNAQATCTADEINGQFTSSSASRGALLLACTDKAASSGSFFYDGYNYRCEDIGSYPPSYSTGCGSHQTPLLCNGDDLSCEPGFGCVWNSNNNDSGCLNFGDCHLIAYPRFENAEHDCNEKWKCYWESSTSSTGKCKTFSECTAVGVTDCNKKPGCVVSGTACQDLKSYCNNVGAEDTHCWYDSHYSPAKARPFKSYTDIKDRKECLRLGGDKVFWTTTSDTSGSCLEFQTCSAVPATKAVCEAVSSCGYLEIEYITGTPTSRCVDKVFACSAIVDPKICEANSSCFWNYSGAGQCGEFTKCEDIGEGDYGKANCMGKNPRYCYWVKDKCVPFVLNDWSYVCPELTNATECNNTNDHCVYIDKAGKCVVNQSTGVYVDRDQCRANGGFWKSGTNANGGYCYPDARRAGFFACSDYCDSDDCVNDTNCFLSNNVCFSTVHHHLLCAGYSSPGACVNVNHTTPSCYWNSHRGGCFEIPSGDGCTELFSGRLDESTPYDCSLLPDCIWNSRLDRCYNETNEGCSQAPVPFDCNLKSYCAWNSTFGTFGGCLWFTGCNDIEIEGDCKNKSCGWDEKNGTCGGAVMARSKMTKGQTAAVVILSVFLVLAVAAVVVLLLLYFLVIRKKAVVSNADESHQDEQPITLSENKSGEFSGSTFTDGSPSTNALEVERPEESPQ